MSTGSKDIIADRKLGNSSQKFWMYLVNSDLLG